MNRHLGLFLITVVTTTTAGALQYAAFQGAWLWAASTSACRSSVS
jgi:hypothetical protein